MLSLLLVFCMGALLPFAFAPLSIYALAFVAPAVLLYQWQKSTPLQALIKGSVFGLGFYGVGVSWVFISIHTYGGTSAWVAGLITFAMISVLCIGFATQGYMLTRLFGKKNPLIFCLIAFPATWVIWEWLRSLPLGGFPWLYLGYSQMHMPLRGFAPLVGVYGVSLAVAMVCGCLVLLASRQSLRTNIIALAVLGTLLIGGWCLTKRSWTQPTSKSLTVTIVQANISQSLKWEPGQFEHIVQTYQDLTQPYWDKSRLIIWPEAAIPAFPEQVPGLLAQLDQTAAAQRATLLLGTLLGDLSKKQYYNGMLLLGADHGDYRKRHLVPFGEYTPLATVFSFLINYWQIPMSDLTAGPAQQPALTVAGISIAPFICYEIAYPLQVLHYARGNEVLVNISDDSWFGKSLASAQQAEMAQMRALETGKPVLLAANTGITGIVDPFGNFTSVLPAHQAAVLAATVTPMQGQTPLMYWNYFPLLGIIIILLLAGLFL